MKTLLFCTLFTVTFLASPAWAAGGGSGSMVEPKPADPYIEKAQAAIAKQDWNQAREIMRGAVARNPGNAEYHNLYAYSLRKGDNPPMDEVFRHYNQALFIDPDSRNAHEYLGEAYLMTGNLEKAKEHLAILDRLCTFPCSQYTMLKQAVADYESKQTRK